jgi:hypothetical protein
VRVVGIDVDAYELGGIFRVVRRCREHDRDGFSDVADDPAREDGLAVGEELFPGREPEPDRGDIDDVRDRPRCDDPGHPSGLGELDAADLAVRDR